MPDPLDTIMNTLRHRGGVDPNTAARRKAQLGRQRRTQQVPGRQQPRGQMQVPERQPRDELERTLQDIGEDRAEDREEETKEGEVDVGGYDMIPVIVDQLNESILSLKVQIHRTRDREERRKLENQAEKIRDQIQELGGEPIWADETVEEGLQKLRGRGYVGGEQLEDIINEQGLPESAREHLFDQAGTVDTGETAWETPGESPESPAYQADQRVTGVGRAARPYLEQRGAGVSWDPDTGQVIVEGPEGTAQLGPTEIAEPGVAYAEESEMDRVLRDLGLEPDPVTEEPREAPEWDEFYEPAVTEAPEPRFNDQAVQNMIQEYGLEPMGRDEIREYADAMVQRQALGRKQAVERQLERFEEDFPHEFERAKERIEEAAAEMSAEVQGEMAARGMYYSSVMAQNLAQIDEEAMDHIAEISRDAAQYVSGLHRDLQEIEEWKAVERETLRHEIFEEERERGAQLAQMRLSAMQHADQYALDAWAQEQNLMLQDRANQFQEFQFEAERALQEQSAAATAQLANHPMFEDFLQGSGIRIDEFQNMPFQQQAQLMQQAPEVMGMQLNMQQQALENELLTEEIYQQKQYGRELMRKQLEQAGLDIEELELGIREKRNMIEAREQLNAHYRETLAQLEADELTVDQAREQLKQMGIETDMLDTESEFLEEQIQAELSLIAAQEEAEIAATEELTQDDRFNVANNFIYDAYQMIQAGDYRNAKGVLTSARIQARFVEDRADRQTLHASIDGMMETVDAKLDDAESEGIENTIEEQYNDPAGERGIYTGGMDAPGGGSHPATGRAGDGFTGLFDWEGFGAGGYGGGHQ